MTDPKAPPTPGGSDAQLQTGEISQSTQDGTGGQASAQEGPERIRVSAREATQDAKVGAAPSGARTAQQFYDSRGTLMFMVDEQTQAAIFRFAEAYAARQVAELTKERDALKAELGEFLAHEDSEVLALRDKIVVLTRDRDRWEQLSHFNAEAAIDNLMDAAKAQETIRERDQTVQRLQGALQHATLCMDRSCKVCNRALADTKTGPAEK